MNVHAPLLHYLAPIQPFLDADDTTEVVINKPNEVWVEGKDGWARHEVSQLTFEFLIGFATLAGKPTKQDISAENPVLSCTLPGGERCQIVASIKDRVGDELRAMQVEIQSLKAQLAERRPLQPDDIPKIRNGEATIVLSEKLDINFDIEEIDIGQGDDSVHAIDRALGEVAVEDE